MLFIISIICNEEKLIKAQFRHNACSFSHRRGNFTAGAYNTKVGLDVKEYVIPGIQEYKGLGI